MKTLFTVVAALFMATTLYSQNSFEDLLILKADRNWDKLIKKSEKYTNSNKTRKDPEPYYYLAYGLYKMSFKADRDDKYKNAYKSSFTAVSKMLRYDESKNVQEKHAEFISELKLSLLEIIQNELGNEDYRRGFGWAMRFYKFGRDYIPAYFLDGALRYRKGDKSTARTKWDVGRALLKKDDEDVRNSVAKGIRRRMDDEKRDINSWSKADKEVFMVALYQSAAVLKENLQEDVAKDIMNIGAPYFEENELWNDYYDEIVN